jgi:hypothetical protein
MPVAPEILVLFTNHADLDYFICNSGSTYTYWIGCWYPTDRVPLRTCFSPRQKVRYASTRCHVPPRYRNLPPCLGRAPILPRVQGFEPLPSIWEDSGAATCREALNPPPPRHLGGVWCYHVSFSTGPRLGTKEGSSTDTHPSALDRTRLSSGLRC